MLEGALRFRLGEETFEVGAGGGVLAPKGIPHAYGNARRGEMARYLLVMTPKLRALIQALHEPGAEDYSRIFVTTIPSYSSEGSTDREGPTPCWCLTTGHPALATGRTS